MNLKEFIKETIKSIADATEELQNELSQNGHVVNPPTSESNEQRFEKSEKFRYQRVENIDFDVIVSVGDGTSGAGKAGIKVLSLEVGGSGSRQKSSETVNRLRFSIPLALKPSTEYVENVALFEQEEAEKRTRKENTRKMAQNQNPKTGAGDGWMAR